MTVKVLKNAVLITKATVRAFWSIRHRGHTANYTVGYASKTTLAHKTSRTTRQHALHRREYWFGKCFTGTGATRSSRVAGFPLGRPTSGQKILMKK